MNQQQVIEIISKEFGITAKVSPMYAKIEEWRAWLEGNVKGFHEYEQLVDLSEKKYTKLHRHKTNMLLRGSEDWASILLNEKTHIEIENDASARWLLGDDLISGVLGESDFWRNANELIAMSRWAGTAAFETYVKNMEVAEGSRTLIRGDGIGMNYLCADQIIPITFDNGILREAAFVSDREERGKVFQQVSMHTLENGLYKITAFTIDDQGNLFGDPIVIHTGSPVPWFSVIRKSGINIFDYDSPFGVSIISGNEDILKGLDTVFDNYITDFILGRKMVFMNTSLMDRDDSGNVIPPQRAGAQLFMFAGDRFKDDQLIKEYNPSLRVEENSLALQKLLDQFSYAIGLGLRHYQFEAGTIQTATEYTGSKQDLVQNAAKEMISVEKALKQITKAVLWIGKHVLGAPVDPDTKITIIADDSYIIDQDSERKRWQTEISMGIRSAAEYRMHFFGETEEEAKAMIEPTLPQMLEGKAAGIVSDVELRQFLFPDETPEESAQKLAEIRQNEPTTTQLIGEDKDND